MKLSKAFAFILALVLLGCNNVETTERQKAEGILGSICIVSDESTIEMKRNIIDSIFQTSVFWNFQREPYFEYLLVTNNKFFPYYYNQKTVVVFVNEDNVEKILNTFDVDKYKIKKAVLNDKTSYIKKRNLYADNQCIIFVCGASQTLTFSEILRDPESFLQIIEKEEIESELDRHKSKKSKHDIHEATLLKTNGYSFKLPHLFHSAIKSDTFNWYKIDFSSGSSNVLHTSIPNIGQKITSHYLVTLRNELCEQYVKGSEPKSFVKTEPKDVFPHMLEKVKINGFDAYSLRAWWGMENGEFIGGPCHTYLIEDTINNQYVFFDGFIYSPSQDMGSKNKFKNRKVPKMRLFDVIVQSLTIKK